MRKGPGRRATTLTVLTLCGALLSGCGAAGYTPAGPFRPLPEGAPPQVGPPTNPPAPVPGQPPEPGQGEDGEDPNVVASGLAVPTGLALLPDGSAMVGERDTGRILQVFPDRSPARELMTVPGIDTAGDGGLLGLAVSPTFAEDGLLYAYVSTATDNRVVRFPIGGTPNPVFVGIPRGEVHNGGGLWFADDGTLYVGTGDAGDPAAAADPSSLAGVVLAIDVFGAPVGTGPVFTSGHRDVTAVCQGPDQQLYGTDAALEGPDELNLLTEGARFDGTGPDAVSPIVQVPAEEAGLGGCAIGGSFAFLGALDGERVHVIALAPPAGQTEPSGPDELLGGQYGRLRTVVVDAEGALWITTSNRDGIGTPAEDDDKVLRILPPSSQRSSPL